MKKLYHLILCTFYKTLLDRYNYFLEDFIRTRCLVHFSSKILILKIFKLQGDIHYMIPSAMFGGFSLIAGILSLLLPETKNLGLPDTIEDVESLPR